MKMHNFVDTEILTTRSSNILFFGPKNISSAYNIKSNIGSSMASQLVYASINQTYSLQDLAEYQTYFGINPNQPVMTIDEAPVTGYCPGYKFKYCGEANMNVQVRLINFQNITPTCDGENE